MPENTDQSQNPKDYEVKFRGIVPGTSYMIYLAGQLGPILNGFAPATSFQVKLLSSLKGEAKVKLTIPFRTRETYPISFSKNVLLEEGAIVDVEAETLKYYPNAAKILHPPKKGSLKSVRKT